RYICGLYSSFGIFTKTVQAKWENISSSDWIKVYPTVLPSGNAITIESSKSIDGVELRMYDIQGRHIRSFRLNGFGENTKTTIQTTDVPAGMYVLNAQNGSDFFTQKIVLQ